MFKNLFRKPVMKPEAFQAKLAGEILKSEQIADARFDRDIFSIQIAYVDDDTETTLMLENAYRHYAAEGLSEKERALVLSEWIAFFSTRPGEFKVIKSRLFPIVRHIGYLGEFHDAVESAFASGQPLPKGYAGPIVRPFAGDLVIYLGHESPLDINYVNQDSLIEMDISADEAWDVSFENLVSDSREPVMESRNDAGLVAVGFPNDQWLTPSLLLYLDMFEGFMASNNLESLLLAVPNRQEVLFTDEALPHAMEMLGFAIEEGRKADHPQSNCVFRIRKGSAEIEYVDAVEELTG